MKDRIRKRLTNQVGMYSSELVARKQQLEEFHTKVHRHQQDSHVTKLVKQREELKACLKRQLGTLAVSDDFIAYSDGENQFSVFSILSRQSSDVDVEVTPRSLCFLPNGDLLVTG